LATARRGTLPPGTCFALPIAPACRREWGAEVDDGLAAAEGSGDREAEEKLPEEFHDEYSSGRGRSVTEATKKAAMRFEATIPAVLLALLAPASAAHGAGERARIVLVYDVEDVLRERCPPEGELVARVAAEMGYDPVDAEAPSTLEVKIGFDQAGTALRGLGGFAGKRRTSPSVRFAPHRLNATSWSPPSR
jgi:hypothetical protein